MNAQRFSFIVNALFLLFCSAIAFAAVPDSARVKTSLNDGWRFTIGDPQGAEKEGFDDKNWQKVNVPHTWNAVDAFDEEPGYHRGPGWYRRELNIDEKLIGKRLFLYFEGANQVVDVFVNGVKAGGHIGGYTAFAFDITALVKRGARNLLAVRVDNSFNEDIPPLTADFNFYGGIYRDVWLVATNDLHFTGTDHASSGVRITTPDISNGKGTISIDGLVANDSERIRSFDVIMTVLNDEKREVASADSRIVANPKSEVHFPAFSSSVANPKLWSPDNPYLYHVRVSILESGKVIDEINQPLGFRWFSFDPDKGFFLNGKSIKLRGTNRHQDYAGLGNAVPGRLQVRDMELIRESGFNFVRLAHYPQAPSVLDAADRLGLLIWEEIPIVNYITSSPAFAENSLNMLRDMIRQHRNHPSVILWGYMNEIYLRVPKGRDDLYSATVTLARELNNSSHAEDPTRPTAMACAGSNIYNEKGLASIPDIVGWNLYLGWYGGKMEEFGRFLDDQHRQFPKRPLIVSEYGANGDLRLHSTQPRRFDSTTEYQRAFHESYLTQIEERPYLSGSALWNQFDFGSELRGETIPHINQKGMFTFDRKPKDVVYLYKAALSPGGIIHIATRDWIHRAGISNNSYKIDVYTNLPSVELFSNGKSLGEKSLNGTHKITWDVPMHSGINHLTARGKFGTRVLTDSAEIDYRVVDVSSREIAVNVGSNADFLDRENRVWLADKPYQRDSWGFVGERTKWVYSASSDKDILGTSDDPLYQTMLEGLSSYRFDVPNGNYQVELLFAETKYESPGKRIFTVMINGRTVLENLDLGSVAQPRRAFTKTFSTTADAGINIDFIPVVGEPILSGVRVVRR